MCMSKCGFVPLSTVSAEPKRVTDPLELEFQEFGLGIELISSAIAVQLFNR